MLDVRLVNAPAGVTQDIFTFLLKCLPYFFLREGFSRPFPSSNVKSYFVYPRYKRSSFVGHDIYILSSFLGGRVPVRTIVSSILVKTIILYSFFRNGKRENASTYNYIIGGRVNSAR